MGYLEIGCLVFKCADFLVTALLISSLNPLHSEDAYDFHSFKFVGVCPTAQARSTLVRVLWAFKRDTHAASVGWCAPQVSVRAGGLKTLKRLCPK